MINVEYKDNKINNWLGGIMGYVVGDALGVPVEFSRRKERKDNPVDDMWEYGTHNQPKGTWSDDSTMTIATMEFMAQAQEKGWDYKLLMDKFYRWFTYGEYTPYGECFDIGNTTSRAIMNYKKGINPLDCGGMNEKDNGNGSLMRILPVSFICNEEMAREEIITEAITMIKDISALTHGHARSVLACIIYSKIVAVMINNKTNSIRDSIVQAVESLYKDILKSPEKYGSGIVSELDSYLRVWNSKDLFDSSENQISSSGYVVHTLEAVLWCLVNSSSYSECILKAVNLGDDTDTVAAIAGGLAGIYYGYNSIPGRWLEIIPRREWIEDLARQCAMI